MFTCTANAGRGFVAGWPRKTEKRPKDVEMAVASGAKVSHMLSALRAGDLSPFGVDLAHAG